LRITKLVGNLKLVLPFEMQMKYFLAKDISGYYKEFVF